MAAQSPSILITGASTGIGRATALRLDKLGFRVFAAVRKRGHAEQLDEVTSERLEPVIIDVTDDGTIEGTRERIEQVTGGRLDGLVNNAGIGLGGAFEAVPMEVWREQFEVNVFGQVAVTTAFMPMLREAKGRIVFISSVAGRTSVAYMSPYSASKHAIEAVGDALRAEVARFGVRVSIVEPGSIATDIWEKAEATVETERAAMSAEHSRLYGSQLDNFFASFLKLGKRGIAPEKVAAKIEHALTAKRPRPRYLVGLDAYGQVAANRLLPARGFDRAIGRFMKTE